MARCTFCDHRNPTGAQRCESCGAELPGAYEQPQESLEEMLAALLADGQKIEAVKLYRERTGAGLREAKDAVEALERGEGLPPEKSGLAGVSPNLEQDVVSLLQDGRKMDAIKLYREQTGAGLAEAKQAVEALGADHGIQPSAGGCATVLLSVLLIVGVLTHLV